MYENSRQSWILDSMDSRNWISDSLCVELGFRIPIYQLSWIPDYLSCITIPKPQISESGYSNSFTWAYNILTSIIYFFWSSSFFFTGS